MTRAQFSTLVAQHAATFVVKKDGIEWWRLRDGSWYGAKDSTVKGIVQLKRFPAGSCNCG